MLSYCKGGSYMLDLSDLSGDYEQIVAVINKKRLVESIIQWMLDEKCSIRMCAYELGLSKSLVHSYIHSYVRKYYLEEYEQILTILKWNKKYRCKPRRLWRGTPW